MKDIALATLLASAASPNAAAAAEGPAIGREIGQAHPQIVLPSLDAKRTLALSDFRGKKVLLIEFASW